MKIALFYFSSTGNTKLVSEVIASKINNVELFNVTDNISDIDFDKYELSGFVSSTFNLTLPPTLKKFIDSINKVTNKPAFILFTYGVMPGKAIVHTANLLSTKGFKISAYHALHMPDSFPPFIQKGITNSDSPNSKELQRFKDFMKNLDIVVTEIEKERSIPVKKVKPGFWDTVIPVPKISKVKKSFGELYVDKKKCTKCGRCIDLCHSGAIKLDNYPEFKMDLCQNCYSCYNLCPQNSIITTKLIEGYQYKQPIVVLKEKLYG